MNTRREKKYTHRDPYSNSQWNKHWQCIQRKKNHTHTLTQLQLLLLINVCIFGLNNWKLQQKKNIKEKIYINYSLDRSTSYRRRHVNCRITTENCIYVHLW